MTKNVTPILVYTNLNRKYTFRRFREHPKIILTLFYMGQKVQIHQPKPFARLYATYATLFTNTSRNTRQKIANNNGNFAINTLIAET